MRALIILRSEHLDKGFGDALYDRGEFLRFDFRVRSVGSSSAWR